MGITFSVCHWLRDFFGNIAKAFSIWAICAAFCRRSEVFIASFACLFTFAATNNASNISQLTTIHPCISQWYLHFDFHVVGSFKCFLFYGVNDKHLS